MKINWLEYDKKEHVLAWLLCEVIAPLNIAGMDFDSSALDVVLTINGVEVDFIKAAEFLQSQLDKIQKDAAEDAIAPLRQDLETLVETISRLGVAKGE